MNDEAASRQALTTPDGREVASDWTFATVISCQTDKSVHLSNTFDTDAQIQPPQ